MILNEMQDLFEMPEIIPDTEFGLDIPKINVSQARKYISYKLPIIDVINGNKLYKNGNELILIDETNEDVPTILYFVKYVVKKIHYIQSQSAQQIVVWRTPSRKADGVSKDVFFKYILPITGCIVTDVYQTNAGKRFWEARLHDAWESGLNVYFIDIMPPNRKIIPIRNYNELYALKDQIWGDGNKYHERRVIITNFNVNAKAR